MKHPYSRGAACLPAYLAAIFIAIFTVFGGATILNAQTPLARFVLPTNTNETAVQPTFRVVTKYKIDTSSVNWNFRWIDGYRCHADRRESVRLARKSNWANVDLYLGRSSVGPDGDSSSFDGRTYFVRVTCGSNVKVLSYVVY